MRWVFVIIAAVLATGLIGWAFARADAAKLAAQLRIAGPVVIGAAGLALLLLGRVQLGFMLIAGGGALYASGRRSQAARKSPGKRSMVRTAALDMELDHDSGALEGVVLAGRHEGRVLGEMDLSALLELHADLGADAESSQLLETYLDGRFPAWRKDADADTGDRQRSAPGSGAMTEQEAYQILGLEAGASTADIRKAHRRLMQRLHPDLGGSSFLAARINQAKDLLLSVHD